MDNETIYYVDESGDLDAGGSDFYLLGCAIINDAAVTAGRIKKLESEIKDSIVLNGHSMKNGFHACENHPEIYQTYIELIFSLDFRAYVVVLDKRSGYFKQLIKNNTNKEIYNKLLFSLFEKRFLKRSLENNIVVFERQGNKLHEEKREKEKLLQTISEKLKINFAISSDINFEVNIVGKDNVLVSVIDFVLHIISRVYDRDGVANYMKRNFELIEPKIGLIFDAANNKYYKLRTLAEPFL
jgi:hypothetical protein